MNKTILKKFAVSLVLLAAISACKNSSNESAKSGEVSSKRAGVNEVVIHEKSDFDKLNAVTSTAANSGIVLRILFPALLKIDPQTFEYIPFLAESRPTIVEINDGKYAGGLSLTYRIRTEAVWPNGTPVTGEDVDFTIKATKNPQVDAQQARPYLEFIDSIKIDETDNKKFTLYCKDRYFMAEIQSAVNVIPEYVYDPEKIMRKFTIHQLNNSKTADKLQGNADIIRFAQDFNSEKYQRQKGFVVGCGPYEFDSWTTGQRLVLTKVKNWWGEKFIGKEPGFENYPDKITYEIVTEWTTAVTALKDEGFDAMNRIPSKDFVELKENEAFNKLYTLSNPLDLSYNYVGINVKNPKLSDKRVRQALAQTMDIDYIIKILYYGLAERTVGPIHPSQPYYNKNLKPYPLDLAKAKDLLKEAGWSDTDGDGIVDKVLNGKQTPLKLELTVVPGSPVSDNIAAMFQKNLEKIGVKLEIIPKEWTVFSEETKAHKFEMYFASWSAAPTLDDLKQIWHTTSYNGGSNYVGFGNQETDDLIDKIRYESNVAKRDSMYMRFQEITYDEVPYIFMLTPLNKIAIHKRFDTKSYVYRPGYMVEEFKLNPGFGTKQAVAANP